MESAAEALGWEMGSSGVGTVLEAGACLCVCFKPGFGKGLKARLSSSLLIVNVITVAPHRHLRPLPMELADPAGVNRLSGMPLHRFLASDTLGVTAAEPSRPQPRPGGPASSRELTARMCPSC